MTFIALKMDKSPISKPFAVKALKFAFGALKRRKFKIAAKKLTVALLPKEEMQALNQRFRKKNRAADILSFSPTEEGSLGELALFCDPARAKQRGLKLEEEAAWLLIHGILHLLGYEHEEGGEEADKFFALQDSLFNEWRGRALAPRPQKQKPARRI